MHTLNLILTVLAIALLAFTILYLPNINRTTNYVANNIGGNSGTSTIDTATSTDESEIDNSENLVIDTQEENIATEESVDTQEIENLENITVTTTEEVVETVETSSLTEEIEIIEETQLLTFSDINTETRKSLVNILCTTNIARLPPISGSGVVISDKGVILTNAHIAQYFLLKNYPNEGSVNCMIRMGSPAKPKFRAELLYISPDWIKENAEMLIDEHPLGTGEDDFALLLISKAVSEYVKFPETFDTVQLDVNETTIEKEQTVFLGGYPAGFLGGETILKDLYITSTIAKLKEIYTFNETTLDVVSLGGSIVAQQGISGGAVMDKFGKLIALISTSSDGETTTDRDLRAITLSHINRNLVENNDITLEELLDGDLDEKAKTFNSEVAPELTDILIDVLP